MTEPSKMADSIERLKSYTQEELGLPYELEDINDPEKTDHTGVRLMLINDKHRETIVQALRGLPWRPIEELYKDGQYDHANDSEAGLLLLAPELVDEDCNVHGVGMGYFQDDAVFPAGGYWSSCRWSMTNDEWYEKPCNPTHYIRLTGVNK
jgi:hypothetical protein